MPDIVIATGPVFDGRAEDAARRYCDDVKKKLAQEGVDRVRHRLEEVIRHQVTGRAVSEVHIDNAVSDLVVTNDPIVYGPWLEGVSQRNHSTRFKGYHTFRLVGDQLERDAEGIAEARLRDGGYLEEMN
jgi:hypothetical protein